MNAGAERKQASSPDHVQGRKKILITERKEIKNGKTWKENKEEQRGDGGGGGAQEDQTLRDTRRQEKVENWAKQTLAMTKHIATPNQRRGQQHHTGFRMHILLWE